MNPVIFTYKNFELRWYSVLMLVAIIIGMKLVDKESERFNIKKDFIFNMSFWAIIFGFIGARLYYVVFNWSSYSGDLMEILKVWHGGLAIHGGIIGGLLTVILYCSKYRTRPIRYFDFIVPALALGQAIGRWGNFFNSEAHGLATKYETLKKLHIPNFVINGMKIDGTYYTPTFFFESIACLLLFLILIAKRRGKYTKVGTPTAIYLIVYGIIRFFIEISRTDALMIAGFKMAQIVSIIMIIIGLILLIKNGGKSKFEDLYNDRNNVDKIMF